MAPLDGIGWNDVGSFDAIAGMMKDEDCRHPAGHGREAEVALENRVEYNADE